MTRDKLRLFKIEARTPDAKCPDTNNRVGPSDRFARVSYCYESSVSCLRCLAFMPDCLMFKYLNALYSEVNRKIPGKRRYGRNTW
jgi:hypothetical protein